MAETKKGIDKDGVISKKVFNYLQNECPEFLHSYSVLSNFYVHLTENFDRKQWKDGRIVLTPKKQTNVNSTKG